MSNELKFAVEAMTGGKNTVIYDDKGLPSIMVVIPKFKISDVIEGGSDEVHPAFIVNGNEVDKILISKYQNIVEGDRAYSLPNRDPRTYVNFDQAVQYCKNKGPGWHLMTNSEWAAIALWCKKNDYLPRGNNNYGKDHSAPNERGVVSYRYMSNGKEYDGRVATGSGPSAWAHNGQSDGIFDLNGNVWEWVGGMRLLDGEIQLESDQFSDYSGEGFKAVDASGNLVAQASKGSLKFDGETATPSGIRLAQMVSNRTTDATYLSKMFETVQGIEAPEILKLNALMPASTELGGDNLYVRNNGERLPLRGGAWTSGSSAGVFYLYLNSPRSSSNSNVGFRSAYVL